MASESEHNEQQPIKTGERLPAADAPGTEESAPEITRDLSFSRPQTAPRKVPGMFSRADRGSQERLATGLQRQKGNAFVQRMIQQKIQINASDHPPQDDEQLGRRIQTASHVTPVARQAEPQTQPQAGQELAHTPRAVSPVTTLQRYQAGDTGHGGIEKEALTGVGFSADDASQIYFGNWLRDLSQVPPSVLPLINIVALGEFNRTVNQQDLGTYVPSEHLDNPTGGGTIEDRPNHAPAMTDEKADEACRDNNLSGTQCAEFKDEEHHREDIIKASADSHLPVYIERGKYHAKRILEQAIAAGPTPEGRSLMGNALHAIEDYFSHSNFVEAAILTLKKEGVGGKKVDALVDRLKKTTLGEHAVNFDPKTGEPEILTGTYKGKANKTVTELEIFKSELEHGQLTRAFMLGLLRQGGIGLEELGKHLGQSAGAVAGGVLGGILGGIRWGLPGL